MERHLLESINTQDVADYVNMSCLYLQRGFQILTGYTLSEYMRNRRLYLAAKELKEKKMTILDIALKYGYENQSSFDKAFMRFHEMTPKEVQKGGHMKTFLPLVVKIEVTGGENMSFRIEEKNSISVVGLKRRFSAETAYQQIPAFWDEMIEKYCGDISQKDSSHREMKQFVYEHHIGEFGICIEGLKAVNQFDYMIAGYDRGKDDLPKEIERYEIPAGQWAVFDCTLKTLQQVNDQIWKQWLPSNPDYEIAGEYSVEWYSPIGEGSTEQKCEIWIPVIKK